MNVAYLLFEQSGTLLTVYPHWDENVNTVQYKAYQYTRCSVQWDVNRGGSDTAFETISLLVFHPSSCLPGFRLSTLGGDACSSLGGGVSVVHGERVLQTEVKFLIVGQLVVMAVAMDWLSCRDVHTQRERDVTLKVVFCPQIKYSNCFLSYE